MNPLQKNQYYNPNDPKSNRWVTPAAPVSPVPTSISQIFQPFVDPFKKVLQKPAVIPTKPPVIPGPNMSYAPTSVIPNAPVPVKPPTINAPTGGSANQQVLAQQKALNAKGAGLIEDGIMGPKTQAAIAKYGGGAAPTPGSAGVKPTLPLNNAGAIDYKKLADQAGAAGLSLQEYVGLIEGQATPGTKEYEDIYTKLGIPDLVTSVYSKPAKTTQSIYEEYYNASGLGDIKKNIAELDKRLNKTRNKYTEAIKEHKTNPWISATTRAGRLAVEREIYGQEEANDIALRQSYLDQYNLGVDEVEKIVGRVGGDLEFDRTLSADKLNYLLNEAERTAGLATKDATKEGLRYSGNYLTSRKQEKINEENRAYAKQVALKKMDAANSGTDLASIISKVGNSNPNAKGYLNALNNILAIGTTKEEVGRATKTLAGYIADGNDKQAREYLQQLALGNLSGADKSDAMKRTGAINAYTSIKEKLNDYAAKYGDTNILTGSIQNIQQKLGTAGNAEAASLNTELTKLLQSARVETTGAAWGAQETAEYEKTNANLKNTNKLNMALIDANLDILNRNNASAIQWVIGPDTYNQIYTPPKTQITATTTLPSFYAKADPTTKATIDKMVADGVPEATILELFK